MGIRVRSNGITFANAIMLLDKIFGSAYYRA